MYGCTTGCAQTKTLQQRTEINGMTPPALLYRRYLFPSQQCEAMHVKNGHESAQGQSSCGQATATPRTRVRVSYRLTFSTLQRTCVHPRRVTTLSQCDNLVTTIPIAHHREQTPVMKSKAVAVVSVRKECVGGGRRGPRRNPATESSMAQVQADSLAQALKSGEAPPVAKMAGEDYKRKGIVRTPPSVQAPPSTA